MDRSGEMLRLQNTDTMRALAKLAEHYRRAIETAPCRLALDESCPAPRDAEACRWGPTKFCAARLKTEAEEGRRYDREVTDKERTELATVLSIPKGLWAMLGVVHSEDRGWRVTEASRFARYAAANRKMRVVLITGADGTGKATAAAYWCWLIRAWYYRATNLRWYTKSGFNRDDSTSRVTSSFGLAIVGLDKPWALKDGSHKQSLIHIVHERLDAGKRTLITSNMTEPELQTTIGSSLWYTAKRTNGIARVTEVAGQQEDAQESAF